MGAAQPDPTLLHLYSGPIGEGDLRAIFSEIRPDLRACSNRWSSGGDGAAEAAIGRLKCLAVPRNRSRAVRVHPQFAEPRLAERGDDQRSLVTTFQATGFEKILKDGTWDAAREMKTPLGPVEA